MSYQDICKGLKKEAGMKKEALKGIGRLGSRYFGTYKETLDKLLYPVKKKPFPQYISKTTASNILSGREYLLERFRKHFNNPEKMSLLFRSAARNPTKYSDAMDLVATLKGNPGLRYDLFKLLPRYQLDTHFSHGSEGLKKFLSNIVKL